MKKLIIFDKDGTLLDFDAFWIVISKYVFTELLEKYSITSVTVDKILYDMGYVNGVVRIDSVLCYGTFKMMSDSAVSTLKNNGIALEDDNAFYQDMVCGYQNHFDKGVVKPTCENLAGLLEKLIENGAILSLVTTDNPVVTKKCLQCLGVSHLFEKIFCDDGVTPAKPNPYSIDLLCETYGVDKSNVYMVGDTVNDVKYANNGNINFIGYAKDRVNKEILLKYTDQVVDNLNQLLTVIK